METRIMQCAPCLLCLLFLLTFSSAKHCDPGSGTCAAADTQPSGGVASAPRIIIGCWQLTERHSSESTAVALLQRYVGAGFTTFDTGVLVCVYVCVRVSVCVVCVCVCVCVCVSE